MQHKNININLLCLFPLPFLSLFFAGYDLGTESLLDYARICFFTKMKINAKLLYLTYFQLI